MLLVSLNSGQTFVSSNVNITAKNCTKVENGTETDTEKGTETDNETKSGGGTKPEVRQIALGCLFGNVLIF